MRDGSTSRRLLAAARRQVETVPAWVPDLLRFAVVGLVVVPGGAKFLSYETSVAMFTRLDIPAPAAMVVVVGVIELAAAALLLADRGVRVAAASLLAVVLVAALTAGPTWQNVGTAGACLVLLATESATADRQTQAAGAGTDGR